MLTDQATLARVQDQFASTAVYPKQHGYRYLTTGLISEVGELANVAKKVIRGDKSVDEMADRIKSEYADVCWYVVMRGVDGEDNRTLEGVTDDTYAYEEFLIETEKLDGRSLRGDAVALCTHIEEALMDILDGEDSVEVTANLGLVISKVLGDPSFGFSQACIDVARKLADRRDRGVLRGDGDNR
jgi:hypothetical protein